MTIATDFATTTTFPRRVIDGAAASVRAALARQRARPQCRQLLGADDAILKDVGLERSGAARALRELWHGCKVGAGLRGRSPRRRCSDRSA